MKQDDENIPEIFNMIRRHRVTFILETEAFCDGGVELNPRCVDAGLDCSEDQELPRVNDCEMLHGRMKCVHFLIYRLTCFSLSV